VSGKQARGPADVRVGDEVLVSRSQDPIAWYGTVLRVGSTWCLVQAQGGPAVRVGYEQGDRRGTSSTEDRGVIYPISVVSGARS
jgi:hypothetical protein